MKNEKAIVILPRTEPDLDGVACAVAYSEFLNKQNTLSKPWYNGNPDAEARYLIDLCKGVIYANKTEVSEASKFILVDASGLEGLPVEVNPEKIVEVIDHRFHHNAQNLFLNAKLQIESVGAAATLIVEKFVQEKLIPSYESGIMLYGAIHSNTSCLKGTITTDRDKEASSWLEKNIAIPDNFLDNQFAARRNDLVIDLNFSIRQERKEYSHPSGEYAISQLEFHGSGKVLNEKLEQIENYVQTLLPRTMLNMVDLETNCTYIFTVDSGLKELLSDKIGVTFLNNIATTNGIILRKQIVDKIQGF